MEDIIGGLRTHLTLSRLMAIKEKLKQQRKHIEDLDKHMSVPTTIAPNSDCCGLY